MNEKKNQNKFRCLEFRHRYRIPKHKQSFVGLLEVTAITTN